MFIKQRFDSVMYKIVLLLHFHTYLCCTEYQVQFTLHWSERFAISNTFGESFRPVTSSGLNRLPSFSFYILKSIVKLIGSVRAFTQIHSCLYTLPWAIHTFMLVHVHILSHSLTQWAFHKHYLSWPKIPGARNHSILGPGRSLGKCLSSK